MVELHISIAKTHGDCNLTKKNVVSIMSKVRELYPTALDRLKEELEYGYE